uniref:NADH-ubiquinone oxidoreductase chain 2 n=1 Tax=Nesodiprion biremis TaxID=2950363 RepID=A0A977TLB1_9HYME|nr:NADH dehydrogenase subunit 2 [Nesodiprion biremis]UXW93516.1 NADH dehydrogenase subunit 2 [Nesodiprion biremis]
MMSYMFFKKFMQLINLNKYFYFLLFFSILIIINSSSWISAWMGMEMNLLMFIPLLMNNKILSKYSNSCMIYYIIQVGASSMLLMMIMMMKMTFIFNMNLFIMMIQLSLILKLGASPLHWWLVKIMNNLSWLNCFLILTLQKVGPLFMLINTNISLLIYLSMLLSGFIGSFVGINQTSLKLIMVYSSLNHLSWMFMSMMIDFYIFLIYLLFYFINNFMICLFFMYFNMNYLDQVFKFNNMNYFMKFLTSMMFLSMAGVPPMFGFLPKFFVFIMMVKNLFIFECLLFIMFTLIVLFYYMNFILSSLLYLKLNFKLNLNNLNLNFYYIIIIMFNVFIMLMTYFLLMLYFNN